MAQQFTVPAVLDAVAAEIGDRVLLTQSDRQFSYSEVVERSNRLASYLHARGLGCHTPRDTLAGHEVGQDMVGIYAYNGNEFVEGLLGAFRARVA
ncbi:MAG: AMP-binding protein, partial [Myxococcota bacterium]